MKLRRRNRYRNRVKNRYRYEGNNKPSSTDEYDYDDENGYDQVRIQFSKTLIWCCCCQYGVVAVVIHVVVDVIGVVDDVIHIVVAVIGVVNGVLTFVLICVVI